MSRYVLRTPQGDLIACAAFKWAAVTTEPGVCSSWYSQKECERDLKAMLKDNQMKDARELLQTAVITSI